MNRDAGPEEGWYHGNHKPVPSSGMGFFIGKFRPFDRSDYIETLDLTSELRTSGTLESRDETNRR